MVCERILGLYLLEEEEEFLINIMGGVMRELDILFFPSLEFADGIVYLCQLEFLCQRDIVDMG